MKAAKEGSVAVAPAIAAEFKMVHLSELFESPLNNRKHYDEKKLAELTESIRQKGVLTPLLARSSSEWQGLEIAAGHRRYRSAKAAGVDIVPVLIREMSDVEFLEVLTIENLQREDVHPMDEALGYRELCEKHGYTADMLADRIGKSKEYVYARMKLADLIPELQVRFYSNEISAGHAIIFARLPEASQIEAAKELYRTEYQEHSDKREKVVISVRDLTRWIATNIQMDLGKAAFDTKDPDLVRKVGACVACPKRSGAEPRLWPELGKKDLCIDRHCYNKKLDAFIAQNTGRGKMLPVTAEYNAKLRPAGAVYEHGSDLRRTKDYGKCEFACKAIMVDGFRKAEVFEVCGNKECKKHFGRANSMKSPKEAAADKARRKKVATERLFRARVYEQLCEKIDEKKMRMDTPALVADAVFDRLDHTVRKQIVKELGIIEPKNYDGKFVTKFFLQMEMLPLWQLCIRMVARRNLAVSEYAQEFAAGSEDLLRLANHYGVDHKKIRDSISKLQTSAKSKPAPPDDDLENDDELDGDGE